MMTFSQFSTFKLWTGTVFNCSQIILLIKYQQITVMLYKLNMAVVSDLISSINCLNSVTHSSFYNNLFFCSTIQRRYFFFTVLFCSF